MKFHILWAAVLLVVIHVSPRLFWIGLAIFGFVFLLAIFEFQDEIVSIFRRQRQAKHDEALRQERIVLLAEAQHALDGGNEVPMRALAEDCSLGDAWVKLAEHYERAPSDVRDESAITNAYKLACSCQYWIDWSPDFCGLEYDRRCFLGLGVTPNYLELLERWTSGCRAGERNEVDIAWIYARGPAKLRDYEKAWWWLSLGLARTVSLTSQILPEQTRAELQMLLEAELPYRLRMKIEKEAAAEAYREFVAGR